MTERLDHRLLVREVFGNVEADLDICPRCGKPTDEPFSHVPDVLGGGCIDHNDPLCPFCRELPGECARWCELARQGR